MIYVFELSQQVECAVKIESRSFQTAAFSNVEISIQWRRFSIVSSIPACINIVSFKEQFSPTIVYTESKLLTRYFCRFIQRKRLYFKYFVVPIAIWRKCIRNKNTRR